MKDNALFLILALTVFLPICATISCSVTDAQSVTIGQKAVICLHLRYTYNTISNVTNTTNNTGDRYYAYSIDIDRFLSIKMGNISAIFNNPLAPVITAQVDVYFQNQGNSSFTTFIIYNSTAGITRNYVSFLIQTNGGSFNGFQSDNSYDSGCAANFNNQCFQSSSNGYGTVDGVFYISWIGSDSKNNQYLSQAMRLSRFSLYSVNSLHDTVQQALKTS